MIRPPSSGSSTMTTPAPTPAPVLYLGLRPVDPFGQKVMDFVERLLKSGQCTKAQCDQLIKWYGQLNIGPDAYIDLTALMIRIVAERVEPQRLAYSVQKIFARGEIS